jgi:DNA-directed RNA polymerase specialized sigma24 family protein
LEAEGLEFAEIATLLGGNYDTVLRRFGRAVEKADLDKGMIA